MISIDAADPTPPFEQIRAALADEITSGRLPGGHRLPTVRQIAADLHVAGGTAARAYRELERAGLVVTRRSQGTIVSEGRAKDIALEDAVRDFLAVVRREGVSLADVVSTVTKQWNEG